MLLHATFLIALNLFSVNAVFILSHVLSIHMGTIVQAISAILFNVAGYYLIFRLMASLGIKVMKIDDFSMLAIILLTSLALLPAIYYPLHYTIQGYWNSFDFFVEFWPYQLIVNGLCVVMNFFILIKSSQKSDR